MSKVVSLWPSRDMTYAQFLTALERNGFARPVMVWVESKDEPGYSYGMVTDGKGHVSYRHTLAHILRRRDKRREYLASRGEGGSDTPKA